MWMLNYGYLTMIPIDLLVMYWGYKAYGDFAKGNINLNFPHNGANIVSMLMQSVQCYYGVFFTSITLMMRIETYFGVDPTRGWSVVTRYGVSPAVFRLVFRTFFLATEVLVAAIFLAVSRRHSRHSIARRSGWYDSHDVFPSFVDSLRV